MGYARYVGRIGALAVALGVGSAVAGVSGIASALPDSTDSGSADVGSPTGAAQQSGPASKPARPTAGTKPRREHTARTPGSGPTKTASDTPVAHDASVDEAPPAASDADQAPSRTTRSPRPTHAPRPNRHAAAAPAGDTGPTVARDAAPPTSPKSAVAGPDEPAPAPAPTPATVAEKLSVTTAYDAVHTPADTTAPAAPTVPGAATAAVVASALTTALLDTGAPVDAPLAAPALLLLAAGARRNTEEPGGDSAALPDDVSTGEPVPPRPAMLAPDVANVGTAVPNTPPTARVSWVLSDLFSPKVYGDIYGHDADHDTLTYTASTPAKGTVTINRYGQFTYTPTAAAQHAAAATNASAADKTDTFTVTVTDGSGDAATVDVTVKIDPANRAPGRVTTTKFTNLNSGQITGAFSASDADHDTLTYTGSTTTDEGTVVVNPDGTFTYTPTAAARQAASRTWAPFWDKVDAFVITVDDAHGAKQSVVVTVDIAKLGHVNQAPTNGTFTAGQPAADDGTVTGTVSATDPEHDTLTYTGSTTTSKGTATVHSDGTFSYTPTEQARQAAGAHDADADDKQDTFTVTVSDGYGGSLAVPVRVSIGALANTAPTGGTYTYSTDPQTGFITGTATATDAEHDPLTYSGSVTTPKGTAVVNPTGSFTYEPTPEARHDAAATGAPPTDTTATFDITVSDGRGGTTTIPVSVTILGSNTAPHDGTYSSATDPDSGEVTGTVTATDDEGDHLTYSGSVTTAKGTVVVDEDGGFTYQPTEYARHLAAWEHAAENGLDKDSFDVTVADGHGGTTTVTVSVDVLGYDTAPAPAADPTVGAPAGIDGKVTGSLNVADAESDALTYAVTTGPTRGSVTVDAYGNFAYTPTPEERLAAFASEGDDVDGFAVTVSDGFGKSTVITVTNVPVSPVSAAAVASTVLSAEMGSYAVKGPDGKYYMTVYGGTDGTRVLIFDPADPTHPTTVGTGGTKSYGGVVFAADGKGYQLSYTTTGATSHSYVSVIDPASPTTPTVIDLGDGQPRASLPTGVDGNLYVTLSSTTDGHLAQINPADPTHPVIVDLAGTPSGDPIFGPDGKVYVTTTAYSGASLVRLDPADITHPTIIATGPGTAYYVTFGTDGTIYATSYSGGWGGAYTNYVAVITPANPDHAGIITLPPSPSNYVTSLSTTYGPDGTAYVGVSQYVTGGASYATASYVAVLSPGGGAALATLALPGYPGRVTVGPDGTAYIPSTQYVGNNAYTNLILVVDPQNPTQPVTVTLPGTGYTNAAPVVSPDGTAFALSATTNGTATTYYLTSIDPHSPAQSVDTTIGTYSPSANVSIRGAGTDAAVVLASYNNHLDAIVVTRDDPAHPVTTTLGGNTDRGMLVAADGTLYAVTATYTSGSYSNWNITVIDPDNPSSPTVIPLTGQPVGSFVGDSAGNVLLVTGSTSNVTNVLSFPSTAPQSPTTVTFPGSPMGGGLIATSDGRAVLGTYDNANSIIRLTVIDPADPGSAVTQVIPGTYGYSPVRAADGRYYLSVSGAARVVVIDPADPTHPTVVGAGGQTTYGAVVFGSDGTVFQSSFSQAGSVYHGYVTIIDPSDPGNPVLVDLGDGRPVGTLYRASDGNYYVALSNTSTGTVRAAQIDLDDPTHPVIIDLGAGTLYPQAPVVGPDGSLYFTKYTGSSPATYATQIVRVDPADPAHPSVIATVAGAPTGAYRLSDDTIYQTSSAYSGGTYTFNTVVVTADHPDSPILVTTVGQTAQGPDDFHTFATSDGTLVISRYYNGHYVASVVDPQQPAQVITVTLPGSGADEAFTGPDGTVYVRSTASGGNNTYTSYLTVIDPLDPAGAVDVALPSNYGNTYTPRSAFSPNGTLYLTANTQQTDSSHQSSLIVVDPDDPGSAVTVDLTNIAQYVTDLVVTDDVALVTTDTGIIAVRRDDPDNPVPIDLPAGVSVWGTTGADGVAYVTGTKYVYNSSTGYYDYTTYVLVVDGHDVDHPATVQIAGAPGGTVIVGSDGTAVQTVYDQYSHTVTLVSIERAQAPAAQV